MSTKKKHLKLCTALKIIKKQRIDERKTHVTHIRKLDLLLDSDDELEDEHRFEGDEEGAWHDIHLT